MDSGRLSTELTLQPPSPFPGPRRALSRTPLMTVDRTAELSDLLARRILILDGAMGTMIQSYRLQEAD